MAEKHNRIILVLVKYALKQELSEDEHRLLDEWRSRSAKHEALPDQLRDPEWRKEQDREAAEAPSAEMWQNIRQHVREGKGEESPNKIESRTTERMISRKKSIGPDATRWVAAASVVLMLAGMGWWYSAWKSAGGGELKLQQPLAATLPRASGHGVEMRLAGGKIIDASSVQPGAVLAREGGVVITRTSNGVGYAPEGRMDDRVIHTISTDGSLRQPFEIDLPNGSKVWLDGRTRFAYTPGLREGAEPVVEGQAFFVIAPSVASRPLRVWTGKGEVLTVLGTSFNVRSFAAEPESKVELYTGALRVTRKTDSLLLKPSRMVLLKSEIALASLEMGVHGEIPDWMHPPAASPYFEFRNTPLSTALAEVAGWYRKTIANPDSVKGIPVTGKLPRSKPLGNTLQALEQVQEGKVFLVERGDTIHVRR
jgi:transmembrane sensor